MRQEDCYLGEKRKFRYNMFAVAYIVCNGVRWSGIDAQVRTVTRHLLEPKQWMDHGGGKVRTC